MLRTDSVELVHVSCDLCGGDAPRLHLTPVSPFPGLSLPCAVVTCETCGFMYTAPRPAQECMPALYQRYYAAQDGDTPDPARGMVRRLLRPLWHRYCGQYLSEVLRKAQGSVLEVGCGTGELLEELRLRGRRVHGIDINPASIATCQRKGLPVTCGDLESLSFPPESFDTVILWHVLEHFPSPRRALERIRCLLRPGGRLFLYCPNAESYLTRLFGPYWYQWHLPLHFSHFTPASLRRLARLTDFSVVRLKAVTPEFFLAYSLDLYGQSGRGSALKTLLRSGLHRTVFFRLAFAPFLRLLDWCRRGQGECLQVELRRPQGGKA